MKRFPETANRKTGFTLVELMVSLTIFSIVMLVSVGTLLIMIDINAKAQALYSATTNLSFALDSMTREIRTGKDYYCKTSDGTAGETLPSQTAPRPKKDCGPGVEGNYLGFSRGRDNWQVGYRLVESGGFGTIQQKINNPGGSTGDTAWMPITADDVDIDLFELTVEHTDTHTANGDTEQPIVKVLVKGKISNGLATDTEFNVETHIVQRLLDRL